MVAFHPRYLPRLCQYPNATQGILGALLYIVLAIQICQASEPAEIWRTAGSTRPAISTDGTLYSFTRNRKVSADYTVYGQLSALDGFTVSATVTLYPIVNRLVR